MKAVKIGDRGKDVITLQTKLGITADGHLDLKRKELLKDFN